jgi:predicted GNAT superfamily acetyltransferase
MNIEIRECVSFEDLSECVQLQREVFALPDIEISPVRHLIVTKNAGGFVLGAFAGGHLIGFVLSVPAFLYAQKAVYSHMTAVKSEFQGFSVGARLKWAQRERALSDGIRFIKWTFQPVQSRNAFFNLEKLGAVIKHYEPNFYGTDYPDPVSGLGLDSDRLFAEWELDSPKVEALALGQSFTETRPLRREISVPTDWNRLVKDDLAKAIAEQERMKREFLEAFDEGLVCRGFRRDEVDPRYLLY